MLAQAASIGSMAYSEERSRRWNASRRLRLVFTYSVVVVALGLALSDFCRLTFAPSSGPVVSSTRTSRN